MLAEGGAELAVGEDRALDQAGIVEAVADLLRAAAISRLASSSAWVRSWTLSSSSAVCRRTWSAMLAKAFDSEPISSWRASGSGVS